MDSKTAVADNSSSESLLQQLIAENYCPNADVAFHTVIEAPMYEVEGWNEADWSDSMRRIETLILQAEMRLRHLRELVSGQTVWPF